MSDLKFSPDLFIESKELNKWKKFITSDGSQQTSVQGAESFGVVRNRTLDPYNNYFKAVTANVLGFVTVQSGYAYDISGNRILLKNNTDIEIPNDGIWYWLKIAHKYNSEEDGTISIGGINKALMTGKGTKFTELLRGQPNFSSKIKFSNSVNYTKEYDVLEVIDDENVIIQGTFETFEENLKYIVVGTFTPGYYAPDEDKNIISYDDTDLSLIRESTDSTPPADNIENIEFYIARLRNSGGVVEIQDKRHLSQFKSRAEALINNLDPDSNLLSTLSPINPLVAIEYIKKFSFNGKEIYSIGFDWKFNIDGQNVNTTSMSSTITSGKGGVFTSPANVDDDMFNGWRYYYETGDFSTILKTIRNSDNTFTVILDSIKLEDGEGVCITPNADEFGIVMNFKINSDLTYHNDYNIFPINKQNPTILVDEDQISIYNQFVDVKYFLKSGSKTSKVLEFNENEYYIETAFDGLGNLVDNTKTLTSPDLYFNGGVNAGYRDGWKLFYPSQYALLSGSDIQSFDTDKVEAKMYYKFLGSKTVHVQGRIAFLLPLATYPLASMPNGIRFNTPFKWISDQGSQAIRSWTNNMRSWDSDSNKVWYNLIRTELNYSTSSGTVGPDGDPFVENVPTTSINVISLTSIRPGRAGMLEDTDATSQTIPSAYKADGTVTTTANKTEDVEKYDNPFPPNSKIQLDIDFVVYFDSLDSSFTDGTSGNVDDPTPIQYVYSDISKYTIAAVNNGNSISITITRPQDQKLFAADVKYVINYNRNHTGFLFHGSSAETLSGTINVAVGITSATVINHNVNSKGVRSISAAKITGVNIVNDTTQIIIG